MAIELDFELFPESRDRQEVGDEVVETVYPAVRLSATYWIVGEVRINEFHQTAEVTFYGFLNRAARDQRIEAARAPVATQTVRVDYERFKKYLADEEMKKEGRSVKQSLYHLAKTEPEPFGLKNFFGKGRDVFDQGQAPGADGNSEGANNSVSKDELTRTENRATKP